MNALLLAVSLAVPAPAANLHVAAAHPVFAAHMPALAMDLRAQVRALSVPGMTPGIMATTLGLTLTDPASTPSQLAAARLTLAALAAPRARPAVSGVIADLAGADPAVAAVSAQLTALAQQVGDAPEARQAFAPVLAEASRLGRQTGLSLNAGNLDDLRASLDRFFAGMTARAADGEDAVLAQGMTPLPRPAGWSLTKPADPLDERFTVITGREKHGRSIPLRELLAALDQDDATLLDRLAAKGGAGSAARLIRIGNGKVRVMIAQNEKGERSIWADFLETERHPLLDKLASKFTFAPFRASRGTAVEYEAPAIDKDNAQFTAYGLRLSPEGDALADETLHLYVGQGFLVTTHAKERSSVGKTQRLLEVTGAYKTPAELAAYILGEAISRYSIVVDGLSQDFKVIAEKAGKKETDDSILEDAVRAGRKIDRVYETVLRQKQVLRDLLSQNEFHRSPFVPEKSLRRQVEALDHHLTVLDHYQERKNGLVELYRAKVSNDLDTAMKRLAAISALISPALVAGGLYGMNVALPFAHSPYAFLAIMLVVGASMAVLAVLFRRKGWL